MRFIYLFHGTTSLLPIQPLNYEFLPFPDIEDHFQMIQYLPIISRNTPCMTAKISFFLQESLCYLYLSFCLHIVDEICSVKREFPVFRRPRKQILPPALSTNIQLSRKNRYPTVPACKRNSFLFIYRHQELA